MDKYLVKTKIDTYAYVLVEADSPGEAVVKASADDTLDDWTYDTDYDSSTVLSVELQDDETEEGIEVALLNPFDLLGDK